MELEYLSGESVDTLKDFECGIQSMDAFIHSSLQSFLQHNDRYDLVVVSEKDNGIVAMYVTSTGGFVDCNGEFQDILIGKPWEYLDDDLQVHDGVRYSTLEIDYLAVRKDLRYKGYGKEIISKLSRQARESDCYFLTVDAYHDTEYSAIPFYEKCGFFALQEYSEEQDTLRMAMRV